MRDTLTLPIFLIMSAAGIEKMSASERLSAMEKLWDALCHEETELSSLNWHQEVLDQRKERLNSSETRFFTLDQLRDQFR